MKIPKYVIAPDGCEHYLTPGKSYPVMNFDGIGIDTIADNGAKIYSLLEGSSHLYDGNWIIPENEA